VISLRERDEEKGGMVGRRGSGWGWNEASELNEIYKVAYYTNTEHLSD